MSLLSEIKAGAIDSRVPIMDVLRRCKLLAAKLGNQQFKEWVENELNGYKDYKLLPPYRIFAVESRGDFIGPGGSQIKNGVIPMGFLPEKYRDFFSHAYLCQPISSHVDLLREAELKNPVEYWPADTLELLHYKVYQYLQCASAWKVIPRNSIAGLIDTIRTKILNFVIEVEDEAPNIESIENKANIPQDKIRQFFNANIRGEA